MRAVVDRSAVPARHDRSMKMKLLQCCSVNRFLSRNEHGNIIFALMSFDHVGARGLGFLRCPSAFR